NNYEGRFDVPHSQTSPGAEDAVGNGPGEDWYWFDYGNVRFIAIPDPYSGATWSDWRTHAAALMDEAEADPAIRFIVTFGHRPAYSSGWYHPGFPALQTILGALGATHGKYVLDLSGHSHSYERSHPQSGVVHVTAGIGGSNLEQSSGSCLWPGGCPPPSWTAFRAMHHGALRLRFTDASIEGTLFCGPPGDNGSNRNDVTCAPGDILDSFVIGAAPPVVGGTVERRIAAAGDDVEESAGGSISLNVSDLELVDSGNLQTVGLRFTNVTVPAGARITRAWVQFEADEVSTDVASLSIQGQDADDTTTFQTLTSNISSRPRTSAAVSWAPAGWSTVGARGPNQRTPDLWPVVQEIVDRPGWSNGNSLA
ncbi:MAG: hypothetical protein ACRDHK_14585, partial [Actinomycetota bacterium]